MDIGTRTGADAVGVAFYDYHHRTGGGYHADRWFHAASTIKVPVLLGVFAAIEQGKLQAYSRVHVRNCFLSAANGESYRVDASRDSHADVHAYIGRTLQVRELARHMIVTSSNLATNLLIDLVGLAPIQKTLERFGLHGIELLRGVEDIPAHEQDLNNRVTADGLLEALRTLLNPHHFSPDLREEMLDILHRQEFKSGIPAGLPLEARVAHKTGEISTVAHDAGIVFPHARIAPGGADPARGHRHGSRVPALRRPQAGQARGRVRRSPLVHPRAPHASHGDLVPSPYRRRGLLRHRRHRAGHTRDRARLRGTRRPLAVGEHPLRAPRARRLGAEPRAGRADGRLQHPLQHLLRRAARAARAAAHGREAG